MPTAVLLHGTGDSPASWALVRASLGEDWTVLSPPPEEMKRTLLPPGRLTLVGHSYGGWEALRWAAARPDRVAHLVLIEPVLFGLLEGHDDDALAEVQAASSPFSLRSLIDFWGGPGAWDRVPLDRQFRLMAEEPRIRRQVARVARLPIDAEAMAALDVRTTVVCGTETVGPAIALCKRLADVLPKATLTMIEGAGHHSIRTHVDDVVAAITG